MIEVSIHRFASVEDAEYIDQASCGIEEMEKSAASNTAAA